MLERLHVSPSHGRQPGAACRCLVVQQGCGWPAPEPEPNGSAERKRVWPVGTRATDPNVKYPKISFLSLNPGKTMHPTLPVRLSAAGLPRHRHGETQRTTSDAYKPPPGPSRLSSFRVPCPHGILGHPDDICKLSTQGSAHSATAGTIQLSHEHREHNFRTMRGLGDARRPTQAKFHC